MNATNLKASLTTLVNAAVANGDLAAAPLNMPQTVSDLVAVLSAAEMVAVQTLRTKGKTNSWPRRPARRSRQAKPRHPSMNTQTLTAKLAKNPRTAGAPQCSIELEAQTCLTI